MLQLRPSCEQCNKDLPYNSTEAFICTFECTFCQECAKELFKNVCPNCGGGFTPRPIRPKNKLEKYPPSAERVFKPKNLTTTYELIASLADVSPEDR